MADREGFEAMQQDMADHQRLHCGEVTGEANRVLLASEMPRVDAMLEQRSPPTPPAAPEPQPEPVLERRVVGDREYLMSREPDRPLVRRATPMEAEFFARACRRCELLMGLGDSGPLGAPSWQNQLLAVMATKAKASAWTAAANAPNDLATTRRSLEHDQALLKLLGLETIGQLTPEFCRAKAAEAEQQYLFELLEVLDDSNVLGFGDWDAEPPTKVIG